MKKWPKEWLDAVCYADIVLTRLDAVGALKEVPKPREGYVALDKFGRWVKCTANTPGYGWADGAKDRVIKVREVEDSE